MRNFSRVVVYMGSNLVSRNFAARGYYPGMSYNFRRKDHLPESSGGDGNKIPKLFRINSEPYWNQNLMNVVNPKENQPLDDKSFLPFVEAKRGSSGEIIDPKGVALALHNAGYDQKIPSNFDPSKLIDYLDPRYAGSLMDLPAEKIQEIDENIKLGNAGEFGDNTKNKQSILLKKLNETDTAKNLKGKLQLYKTLKRTKQQKLIDIPNEQIAKARKEALEAQKEYNALFYGTHNVLHGATGRPSPDEWRVKQKARMKKADEAAELLDSFSRPRLPFYR